jgi:V8-like Glu-specific endopeptidase
MRRGPKRSRYLAGLSTFALLVALALPFAAAAAPTPAASAPTDPSADGPCLVGDPFNLDKFADLVSDDTPPRGVQTINAEMTVEFVGEGKLLLPASVEMPEEKAEDGERDPEEGNEPLYRQIQLRLFNTRTLNEFLVVMNQAMLEEIADCHAKTGRQSATAGVDDPARTEVANRLLLPVTQAQSRPLDSLPGVAGPARPAVAPGGWSNGIDTRSIRTPTTLWPWRAISQFRYGSTDESRCSGTLIGPRHLITAAHCINEQGTNNWFTIQVTPGKNGVGAGQAQQPYGSSTIKPNPDPGTEAWYFTPEPWRNPAQTGGQWDWGLIVIPDRLGDQTGWMGYVARPGNELRNVNQLNRGYPLCDNDRGNQPANCQDSRLYGDSAYCDIGSFFAKGPDGWNRRFTVSCDLSGGHSGSAVYHYFFDISLAKFVPVVAAVVTHEACSTCGLFDFYPNTARRITPGDLATISWLREVFP